MKLNTRLYQAAAIAAALAAGGCGDSYLDTTPTQFIDQEAVSATMQADPSQVQAYVTGAYLNLYDGGEYHTSHDDTGMSLMRFVTDLFCEDVAYHRDAHFLCYDYQLDNRLGNYRRTVNLWKQLYLAVDNANNIIGMLKPAEGEEVDDALSQALLGQAYTLRAYAYFWLVNLWQQPLSMGADQLGVPVKTEDEYLGERVPVGKVYELILSDISTGYGYLKGKGYLTAGKSAFSEYSAAGIYANILMFTGDYAGAARYAEEAIKGGSLNSAADMLSGFNSLDMPEAIWGFAVTNETTNYYASFMSHVDSYFIGYGGQVGFRKLVSSWLYDKVADDDVRKQWFGLNEDWNLLEVDYSYEKSYGFDKYIVGKFRDIYMTTMGTADPFTSDVIYMRTGEMYFVAAEAYALNHEEGKAQQALNAVMSTRLPGYSCSLTGDALLEEIAIQKRIDTWGEGCRYFDAKRRGEEIKRSLSTDYAADLNNYDAIDYSSRDYRMIYRIPTVEMQNNPLIPESDDNK